MCIVYHGNVYTYFQYNNMVSLCFLKKRIESMEERGKEREREGESSLTNKKRKEILEVEKYDNNNNKNSYSRNLPYAIHCTST